ncbi:unnamed protein product [Nezara viridula]|uniref:DH domain-containing protein n=1 Tax=Nezara viridula TaxID=85310 RepID=A0A9P0EG42_NEZVI|nr:unnamed protein product [Nezara viridula]
MKVLPNAKWQRLLEEAQGPIMAFRGAGEVFTISQDFCSDDGVSLHRGEKVVLISTKGQDPAKLGCNALESGQSSPWPFLTYQPNRNSPATCPLYLAPILPTNVSKHLPPFVPSKPKRSLLLPMCLELINTRVRIDSEEVNLGLDIEELLDSSAAKHKMAIRPKRKYEKRNRQNRWNVQSLEDPSIKGWVPIVVLQEEEPIELLQVQETMFRKEVLLEGIKYYAKEPKSLGRTFLRMERDFDKHVSYCHEEPSAQEFLQENADVRDYFEDLASRLHDDKNLSEHLKLPIQRINDYQLLLKVSAIWDT